MRSVTSERQARTGSIVALIIGFAAAGSALAASLTPEPYTIAATTAAPLVAALLIGPILIRRSIVEPHVERFHEAGDRLTLARRELHDERTTRSLLREIDRGLDQAAVERDAILLLRDAMGRHLLRRSAELHLVDAVEPVLTLALSIGDHPTTRHHASSPWEALAARSDKTLVYETTNRVDVCPHLASRFAEPVAALAIPVNATERLLGVLYVAADEGTVFDTDEKTFLEDLASVIAARIAVLRCATSTPRADAVDRLTGLPDRAAMQDRVIRLLEERQPFTVAVADIDDFGALNDAHGRVVGDRTLQTAARVSRRTIRPDDIVGRIGGDELLYILPRTSPDDATRALERLREELILELSTGDDPTFTLSIGVISSTSGGTIEQILHRAAGALNHAREHGGNRVVIAQTTLRSA